MRIIKLGDLFIFGTFKNEAGILRLRYFEKLFYVPIGVIAVATLYVHSTQIMKEPNLFLLIFVIMLIPMFLIFYKRAIVEIKNNKVLVTYKNIFSTVKYEIDLDEKYLIMDEVTCRRNVYSVLHLEAKDKLKKTINIYLAFNKDETKFRNSLESLAKFLNLGIADKSGSETILRNVQSLDIPYAPIINPSFSAPANARVVNHNPKVIVLKCSIRNFRFGEIGLPCLLYYGLVKIYAVIKTQYGNSLSEFNLKYILIGLIPSIVIYYLLKFSIREIITVDEEFITRRWKLGPITLSKGKIPKNKIEYLKRDPYLGMAFCSDCKTLWMGLPLDKKDYPWLESQIFSK